MDTSNDDLDDSLISFQKELVQLIQNKIFLGKYSERRYVESLQAYRYDYIFFVKKKTRKNLNFFTLNFFQGYYYC